MISLPLQLLLATSVAVVEPSHAHSEGVYECPRVYPVKVPKSSSGLKLIGGTMALGSPEGDMAGGYVTERKNGYDVRFDFDGTEVKYLVCGYGSKGLRWDIPVNRGYTVCHLRYRKTNGGSLTLTCK
jgi:hypothetical protein